MGFVVALEGVAILQKLGARLVGDVVKKRTTLLKQLEGSIREVTIFFEGGSVVSLSAHVVECGDVRRTAAVNAHHHHHHPLSAGTADVGFPFSWSRDEMCFSRTFCSKCRVTILSNLEELGGSGFWTGCWTFSASSDLISAA